MSDIYDLAILGGGPAGITAAIYASRARLNTIWIDKNFAPGGQITATYEVDNYPGMPGISGMDLGEAFGEHARKLGLEPQREKILSLENISGDIKTIRTKKHEYQAKTLILAFGAEHRKLDILRGALLDHGVHIVKQAVHPVFPAKGVGPAPEFCRGIPKGGDEGVVLHVRGAQSLVEVIQEGDDWRLRFHIATS